MVCSVPYQSLIKAWLADDVNDSRRPEVVTQSASVALMQRSVDKGVQVPHLVKLLSLTLKARPNPENNDGTGMN